MCVRLYPDIIVAAEINNMRHFEMFYEKRQDIPEVNISIDGCLYRQNEYKHFGIGNVFVGFEGEEWGKKDYENFLARFPEYFEPMGEEYRVNLAALAGDAEEEDIPLEICDKLFVLGTYPRRVMKALGLYPCE